MDKLNEFADMKIQVDVCNEKEQDVYIKLVTKQILMIIQVPCRVQMLKLLEQDGKVKVTYLKYDHTMIKVTGDQLVYNPIKKYFLKYLVT